MEKIYENQFPNRNNVFILSVPYANAGAFSVTPENFERAMVLHAVKRIPEGDVDERPRRILRARKYKINGFAQA